MNQLKRREREREQELLKEKDFWSKVMSERLQEGISGTPLVHGYILSGGVTKFYFMAIN